MSGQLKTDSISPEETLQIDGGLSINGKMINGENNGNLTVTGTVNAQAIKTKVYEAGGLTAVTLSSSNVWDDFPELLVTFNLETETTVICKYQIAMNGQNSHLCTKLILNENELKGTQMISNGVVWGNYGSWIGHLPSGSHTIKVLYRTPAGGTNDPMSHDYSEDVEGWQTRNLQVLVLGR